MGATSTRTQAITILPGCDLYVSPSGSDSGSGQIGSPLATLGALDGALAPGQTGCLEAGDYGSTSTNYVLGKSGTSGGQITITAAAGNAVTVKGLIEINGSYITLSGLNIDGSNTAYSDERSGTQCPYPVSNGLEINGQHDIFENNNFYQSIPGLRGDGLGVGWNGQADGTIIRYNRIHDLGQCQAYDQMIYLAHGNGVQIYDNWLWNDPHGWGVQIYPGAAGAHVYNNVIDAAGSGFVVGGSPSVSGNTIDHNIVINSTGLTDAGLDRGVGISTCCGLGAGNSFQANDVYNNPGGIDSASGITLTANTTTNPRLADPQHHDYRPATTILNAWNLWDGGLGQPKSLTTKTGQTSRRRSARMALIRAHQHRRHTHKLHQRRRHKRATRRQRR